VESTLQLVYNVKKSNSRYFFRNPTWRKNES
jgi:hypothetical protein